MRSPLLALALVACDGGGTTPAPAPAPVASGPKHAVVIVIDTLRNDAVDAAFTPNLDALEKEGDRVETAWSPGTWTAPSVMSLFTGMPLRQHGWNFPFPNKMDLAKESYPPMRADAATLAEVLKAQGFVTQGFYANSLLGHDIGFNRGFDHWEKIRDPQAHKHVRRAVKAWGEGERHFLYVHLRGPHQPLSPGPGRSTRWGVDPLPAGEPGLAFRHEDWSDPYFAEQYRRAYHAVVEHEDAYVGRILKALGRHKRDAVIIVTSDHGEMLGEHERFGHGPWVWEQLSHVPFYGVRAGDLPDTLTTAALPAIVTDALGIAHTWPTPRDQALPLVTEREDLIAVSPDGRHRGVWGDEQLAAQGGYAVFDIRSDPTEQTPLAEPPVDPAAARAAWEAKVPPLHLEAASRAMDGDVQSMLEELGYMGND